MILFDFSSTICDSSMVERSNVRMNRTVCATWPVASRSLDIDPAVSSVGWTSSSGRFTDALAASARINRIWPAVVPFVWILPVSRGWSGSPARTAWGGSAEARKRFCWASTSLWASKRSRSTSRPWPMASPRRSRAASSGANSACEAMTATVDLSRWLAVPPMMPPKTPPNSSGKSGPSRKNRKVFESTVAVKSRRAMTKAPRRTFLIAASPRPSRPRPLRRRWRRRHRGGRAVR